MDKNELPRSSGGASTEAPPVPLTAQVQVSWSRAARRVPLVVAPDAIAGNTLTRKLRTSLNRTVQRAVQASLRQAPLKVNIGAPQALVVDLSFVSDDEIAELNGDYRSRPRPTDVLSFSQWEDAELVPVNLNGAPLDNDSPVPLGDIVISIETAQRQAAELKHDLLTEVAFLAVHGTLHLCGYDHGTASERRTMWKWQEKIVETLSPGSDTMTQTEKPVPSKRRQAAASA
jgi:probable rRNA maturation factor